MSSMTTINIPKWWWQWWARKCCVTKWWWGILIKPFMTLNIIPFVYINELYVCSPLDRWTLEGNEGRPKSWRDSSRFVISQSEPLLPKDRARKFVNHCGVLVRDNIPINIWEWKRIMKILRSVMSLIERRMLFGMIWLVILNCQGTTDAVKTWALKKMATQF